MMDENFFSCPVGSVITCSLGRFVVPDNLFRQLIKFFPGNMDDVTMLGGEEAPNTFPTPATHDNP